MSDLRENFESFVKNNKDFKFFKNYLKIHKVNLINETFDSDSGIDEVNINRGTVRFIDSILDSEQLIDSVIETIKATNED